MPSAVPSAYARMRTQAVSLLDPLLTLARPGRADLPLVGAASDHGADADRLESFARPLLLAAQVLASVPDGTAGDATRRERSATWFREGLVAGSDPASPHFWGWASHYHQHTVEQGLMTLALRMAADQLWHPLAPGDRALVLRWLASARGVGHVRNNHLFFDILVLEFLAWAGQGEPGDEAAIEHDFRELEAMYRGDGWFIDGSNEAFDPYNAFAFHYYGPMWNRLYGARDPARVARWRAWTASFLTGYEAWFAASGETPAFGRSLTYRFNGAGAFGSAVLDDGCPLPLGRVRRLVDRHIDFFLSRPIRQEQGVLGYGWTDIFPPCIEPYSCAGSPYWAAKAFAPLLLPPTHRYWTDSETSAPPGDRVTVLPAPGFVLREVGGEVELLSATTAINTSNLHRYGPWKWGRLSYRTQFGFTIGQAQGDYPRDGSLTAVCDGLERRLGRHWTIPLEVSAERLQALYILGDKATQRNVRVRSTIRWQGSWQLQIHAVDPFTAATFCLGAQALPLAAGQAAATLEKDQLAAASSPTLTSLVQGLVGWSRPGLETVNGDRDGRRHLLTPNHATPWLETARLEQATVLVALLYAGPVTHPAPWQVVESRPGSLDLLHPDGTTWSITDPELPQIPL